LGFCPNAIIYHDRPQGVNTETHEKGMERKHALIKYADVNIAGPEQLYENLAKLKSQYRLRKLIFRRKTAVYLKRRIVLLKEVADEAQKSWTMNREPGPTYLK
jgi:hypothetical protein